MSFGPASGLPNQRPGLRLGLVGFGRLAQNYYLPALRTSPQILQLVIADPAAHTLAAARRLLPDSARYQSHRELLAAETLDALLVASPPSTHLRVWQDAAALQLPVFMEKPFPLSHQLGAIDPADPAWSRIMVDFNRRFWPPYRQLAEDLRSGKIGVVQSVRLRLLVDPRDWGTVSDHRSQPGEGGSLQDLGSQALDLAAMIIGELPRHLRVKQTLNTRGSSYEIELGFPGGVVAHCEFGYTERAEESVRIQGERGVLSLGNPNFNVHRTQRDSGLAMLGRRSLDLATLGYRGLFRSQSMLRYSVAAALRSFLQSVSTGVCLSPGIEDALRVARWLAAAERALETPEGVPLVEVVA